MPSEAITRIMGLQPYNATDPMLGPLWVLNEFARIDRHQKLNFVVSISPFVSVDVGRHSSSGEFVSDPSVVTHSVTSSGAFVGGVELFRTALREPGPSVDVKYYSPFFRRFDNFASGSFQGVMGESAVDVLSYTYTHIQQRVLPQFAQFFN